MNHTITTIRRSLLGAAAAFVALGSAALAQATKPEGTVTLVVPFAAGGTTDTIARLIADNLQTQWGSAVVVENKPGAGGVIATQAVAQGKEDGTQILFTDIGVALNEVTMDALPYELETALRPVIAVGEWPLAVVVGSNTGIESMADLVAKSTEGNLAFGTFGPRSSPHLAVELLKSLTGAKFNVAHFKGVSPVLQAMASGEVQVSVFGVGAAAAEVGKGTMKVLAVDYKSDLMPEVPTYAEAGVEGMRSIAWWGVFAPAGTPDETVAGLNAAINESLESPAVTEWLAKNGYTSVGGAPEDLQKRVDETVDLWGPLVESAGIKAN